MSASSTASVAVAVLLGAASGLAGPGGVIASGGIDTRPRWSSGAPVPVPTPTAGFEWPLRPQPRVVRGFEPPPTRWGAGHRGVDLAGHEGQVVRAAGAGVVTFSGVLAGRGVVSVRHTDGRRTTYEPIDGRDPVGTVESRGDGIGTLAGGGHCGATPCLHWGLLVGPDDYRDPLTLLQRGRVRLLPLA